MEKDATGCLSLLSHYKLTNPGTRRTSPAAYPTIIYLYPAIRHTASACTQQPVERTVGKADYLRLRRQHPPSVCSHSPSSQRFRQGLPAGMANRNDMHSSSRILNGPRTSAGCAGSGRVMSAKVLGGLRAGSARLGPPPRGGFDDDPRKVSADARGMWRRTSTGWTTQAIAGWTCPSASRRSRA